MVIIFLGSKSDLEIGYSIEKYLDKLAVLYKLHIASAHKTPEHLLKLLKYYESLGKPIVYICIAGRSNALGGFVDAQVIHPVINCPPYSEKYAGLDVLSSLRMPSGVAVTTVLEPEQAALAAAKILGLGDKKILQNISNYHKDIKEKVIKDDHNQNG